MHKTKDPTPNDGSSRSQERRRGTREHVDKLLAERTEMFALYLRLAGINPFKNGRHRESAQKLLQEFCQVLVDYIAAGHFGLYERVINGTERRQSVADLAAELYPRIADTTQSALDFNDKYDCGDDGEIPLSFSTDLSRLGEELAARIDLEDKLIASLKA